MKKHLLILSVNLVMVSTLYSQVKGANLRIDNFGITSASQFKFNCVVSSLRNTSYGTLGHYVVFYMQRTGQPLQLVSVAENNYERNNLLLQSGNGNYQVTLLPGRNFLTTGFTLYPVLIEGDIQKADNVLILISDEFKNESQINNLLNILNKFGQKPLTYTEITK